jgi:hypothetical protein
MYLFKDHITELSNSARINRKKNDEFLEQYDKLRTDIWKHSEQIHSDDVRATGSFTTLEVRRNTYDHEANLASERVMQVRLH